MAVAVALTATSGCALQSDLNATLAAVSTLQRSQAALEQQLQSERATRSREAQAGREHLSETISVAESEIRNESDAIGSQVNRIGGMLGDLERGLAEATRRMRALQHNQAIGLGSLSSRVDDAAATELSRDGEQDAVVAQLGKDLARRSDRQDKELAALRKAGKATITYIKEQDKRLDSVLDTLEALGRQIQNRGKATSSQAASSAVSSKEFKALRNKVQFLGKTLPAEVDKHAKKVRSLRQEIRDLQGLLADLNKRLAAIERR